MNSRISQNSTTKQLKLHAELEFKFKFQNLNLKPFPNPVKHKMSSFRCVMEAVGIERDGWLDE